MINVIDLGCGSLCMVFPEYDSSTVIANLSNTFHHYEEVDSTLRVVDETGKSGDVVAVISEVPPMSEEDRQTVIERLEELGIEYDKEGPLVSIVGVSDQEKFELFMQS